MQVMFDGNTRSVARGIEANPFILDLRFPTPRSLTGLTGYFGKTNLRVTARLYADNAAQPVEYSADFRYAQAGTELPAGPPAEMGFERGPMHRHAPLPGNRLPRERRNSACPHIRFEAALTMVIEETMSTIPLTALEFNRPVGDIERGWTARSQAGRDPDRRGRSRRHGSAGPVFREGSAQSLGAGGVRHVRLKCGGMVDRPIEAETELRVPVPGAELRVDHHPLSPCP